MTATYDSGYGHGTNGHPQETFDEVKYPTLIDDIDNGITSYEPPVYRPSPKHDPDSGWGSNNPIKSQEEGQRLLETGYPLGKQIYNITDDGVIVKFQPDNAPGNGYHSYEVSKPRDIPPSVLKQMYNDGKISRSDYNKFRKGKK